MDTISYQCSSWTQAHNCSAPNQWTRSTINVSARTQALNRSLPNQWAWSAINVLHGHKHAIKTPNQWAGSAINVLHGHKHLIDQCQINGQDQLSTSSTDTSMQLSMPNQLAQSSTHSFRTRTGLLSRSNQYVISLYIN